MRRPGIDPASILTMSLYLNIYDQCMNPLLLSQTNRENFTAMCMLKGEENTNSFYEPHLVLQNTPQNNGEKEAGEFRPDFSPFFFTDTSRCI